MKGSFPNRGLGLRERLYRRLQRTPLYGFFLPQNAPKNFRTLPKTTLPRIPDPKTAHSILYGQLSIAGATAPIDDNIWLTQRPGKNWVIAAHSFDWLGDLCAFDHPKSREKALLLVDQWIDRHSNYSETVWRSDITGRRIINWLCWAHLLFDCSGPSFSDRFCRSVARQCAHLDHVSTFDRDGAGRITAMAGQAFGEIVLNGEISNRLSAGLSRELSRQVLADGGHASRCPETHLRVLSDIILMRKAFANSNAGIPEYLNNAIDRMCPIVRFFRHSDGCFGQFNGGGESNASLIEHILDLAASNGKAPTSIPHSRFERFVAGSMTILLDTGKPASAAIAPFGCAGTFGFEACSGKDRLIVNCGSRANLDADWLWASRTTAAHSTLTIENTNSCILHKYGGAESEKLEVECDRGEIDGDCWLSASHTGYLQKFGLTHRRRFFVDASGFDFRGEDTLIGNDEHQFVLRFHLHPDVTASLLQNNRTALLRTKSGKAWYFRISGGVLSVADSVYLGNPTLAKRSKQLVIEGSTSRSSTTVKWALQSN